MTSPATSATITPPQIRDHSSIPEERTPPNPVLGVPDRVDKDRDRQEVTSSDYEMTSLAPSSSSHPQMIQSMVPTSNNTSSSPGEMAVNGVGSLGMGINSDVVGVPPRTPHSRWPQEPAAYSYSDNEKQLIEEMRRMKKEHQDTLRTYEGRINKLMAKMHELRNIAEMLENSSTKSSPYGLLPAKATLLNIIASGTKFDDAEKKPPSNTGDGDVPPPLPPRPGRGGRIYPNKPIIHTRTRMKALTWNRIILGESGRRGGGPQTFGVIQLSGLAVPGYYDHKKRSGARAFKSATSCLWNNLPAHLKSGSEGNQSTVWHGMVEPKLDTDELERLYSTPPEPATDDVTLLDDIYAVRGRPKHQLLAMFDSERSQRVLTEMRNLRCSLADIVGAVTSLDCRHLHQDSFAELLELLNSPRDVDKILHHVKRKGPGQLDTPEFLIFELSKLDHFRERLEFLRFKNKLQINLFEIDQQLRELNTACDELINNLSLKNVLETILALGNYLNGGTERGQADGFSLDILNKLKDFVDRTRRGNLLELVMRTYCLQYEADLDLGCPTRFRLPEPSNMRHAAQVSFDEIQKALRDLREELSQVRDRLEVLSKRENTNLTIALRVTSENFLTSAVEVLAEEKRYLEDTKGHFWKTTAYFFHTRQCTPQEFFQTWATFLHDCKYYWKLAHRNLARDKFERDFSTKCQLSCSSLPGFTNLKNKMIRTVATLQNDQEMRASKAQQLQHINNWIESVGKYTQEMGPDVPKDTYSNTAGPITHVSPTTVSSAYSATSFHNNPSGSGTLTNTPHSNGTTSSYHQRFQSDTDTLDDMPYESLSKAAMGVTQDGEPSRDSVDSGGGKRNSQDSKKNPNFSLKSWLKRDQRQRTSNDEMSSPNGQSPQIQQQQQQQQQQSAKSPTTPFNKLRNSVVQKFAGGGSSKKSNDPSKGATPVVPPKPPRSQTLENAEPAPSHQILFPPQHQQQGSDTELKRSSQDVPDYEVRNYQNFYYQSRPSKDRFSSGHDSVPSTLSSVTSREFSPNKYEAMTRGEVTPPHQPQQQLPLPPPPQPANVDSKRVKANAVPVYKAKLIPNYENQDQAGPADGARHQRAGRARTARSSPAGVYRQELQRKSEMYVPGSYTSPPQPSPHSHTPPQLPQSQTPHLPPSARGSANSVPSATRDGTLGPVNPSSPHYDEFQTPARRSASAQNILEKSGYGVSEQRQSQTNSEPGGPSHSYLASFGNFTSSLNSSPLSKRDDGGRGKGPGFREPGRDKTPDSGAGAGAGAGAGPSKGVSALINRWEKQQQTPYGNNNHNNHGANLQQHHHGHTNTYPPRSSHTPGRHANDNGSNLDIADSYSDQLRKVSQGSGGGGGALTFMEI
nr:hypothetical protein BaRGS_011649 [Batillaria attramentaria]